jgi:hypothetical protein
LSVLTYTYLYSLSIFPSQYSRIIWPRTFYRSGWLRCDVVISIGIRFMFWAGGWLSVWH